MMPPPVLLPIPSRTLTRALVALSLCGGIAVAFASKPAGPALTLLNTQERQAVLQMAQQYVEYRSGIQAKGIEQASISFVDPSLTGPAPQATPRPAATAARRPLVMSNSAILRTVAENYPPRGMLTRNGVRFLMLGKHMVREGKSFKAVVEDSSYEITVGPVVGLGYTLHYQDATLEQTLPTPRPGAVRPTPANEEAPQQTVLIP